MINQPIPTGKFAYQLSSLIARKKSGPSRVTLEGIASRVTGRYKAFIAVRDKLENLPIEHWTDDEIAALASCYSSSGKFCQDLLKARRIGNNSATPKCPYCQVDNARTWDHFLPSEVFPEFFVFSPNLIRSCSDCNSRKLAIAGHPRVVLNPFFDDLTNVQYLRCRVRRVGGSRTIAATFSVAGDPGGLGYDPYIDEIAKRHFSRLGLERKLRGEAVREMSGILGAASWFGPITNTNVVSLIEKQIAGLILDGAGVNHWGLVFRAALLRVPLLVD